MFSVTEMKFSAIAFSCSPWAGDCAGVLCQNRSSHLPGLSITWGKEKRKKTRTSLQPV